MKLMLSEVNKLFGNKGVILDKKVMSITADSRKVKKGDLFFALIADNDGHEFVSDAIKAGAIGAVVQKEIPGVKSEKLIKVKDTKDALLKLATYYFKKFNKIKVVAVTGSNGKTTTKELLSCLLSKSYIVHKSEKSFNNYLGLPLTVFGLNHKHEVLVLEIGMNHLGEIKKLATAVSVDAAIITNIGRAHIGNFEDKEMGIAQAKAEIMEAVKKSGTVILNQEDKFNEFLRKKALARKLKVLTFGTGKKADTKIDSYEITERGCEFKVNTISGNIKMKLKGLHNIYNASAAITAAKLLGVSDAQIKSALLKFDMKGFMRFEEVKLKNGITVINDCYNANPDSFEASIETLKKAKYKNLVVLMGEMLELGPLAPKLHKEVGAMFSNLGIRKFFIYGENAKNVEKGYGKVAYTYLDRSTLAKDLKSYVKSGDIVFVKGSRGNKLEEIINSVN